MSVKAIGTGTLVTNNYLPDGSGKRVEFRDTLHVPELEINLLSVIHLSSPEIYCAVMFKNRAPFLGPDGDLLGYSPFPGDYGELFPLICNVVSQSMRGGNIPLPVERICAIKGRKVEQLMRLHAAYGHVHAERMLKIVPHMTQMEVELVHSCPICREAKKVRRTFKERNENTKATKPGEVVSVDICEFTSPSIGRANYLFVLIDEYSEYMVVFPIANQS